MKDLACIHQSLQPRAVLGSALDGQKQREQALSVSRSCVLLQGPAKRQMLRLGLSGQPGRISRKKREWSLFVPPVLRKVEMHPTNQVPGGMAAVEEVLHRELGFSEFDIERRIQGSPKILQDICCQVLCTDHRRNGRSHLEGAVCRNGHKWLARALSKAGKGAECGHVTSRELAPVGQYRRQSRSHLVGAQDQQSMPWSPCKGLLEP